MPIPFLDLTRQHQEIEIELGAAIQRVISRGHFVLGEEVAEFEREWSRFSGAEGAASVGSGTDALTLSLIASGAVKKGSGDEVIVPALTAGYTALAVLNAGAVPVFADIDSETCTVEPQSIEDAITPKTKAIVPVHLYGQAAPVSQISQVANRHSLLIIEDAAQAHGIRLHEETVAAAFSFYPTKNLSAYGDGGAIVSNEAQLIERIKLLRQGGHQAALEGEVEGRNSRLDEIQAAVLRVKLKRLSRWNERRRELAALYSEMLSGVEGLKTPAVSQPDTRVFHLYVVQHAERDRLRRHLSERGIETMVHYPFLLHQQKLFRRPEQKQLPVAEALVSKLLSLPLYPQMTKAEVREVANAVKDFK